MTETSNKGLQRFISAATLTLVFAGGLAWLYGAQISHSLWSAIRPNLLPLGVALAVTLVTLVVRRRARGEKRPPAPRFKVVMAVGVPIAILWGASVWVPFTSASKIAVPLLAIGLLWALLGPTFYLGQHTEYGRAVWSQWERAGFILSATLVLGIGISAWYTASNSVTAESTPSAQAPTSFTQQTPVEAVSQQVADTPFSAKAFKTLPALGDNGKHATLVERGTEGSGYKEIQVVDAPLYGEGTDKNIDRCEFSPDADRNIRQFPGFGLTREILLQTSLSTKVNTTDMVLACDNGTPKIYLPTTQLEGGIFSPERVPGPVGVYNGHTGELTMEDSVDNGLPVYPRSLVTEQARNLDLSLTHQGWHAFNRKGEYQDLAFMRPGQLNPVQTLQSADGSGQWMMTPLVSDGGDKATHLGMVNISNGVQAGDRRPYEIVPLPEDAQIDTEQFNSDARSVLNEHLRHDGYGTKRVELVPIEGGTWRSTYASHDHPLYYALAHPDGSVEVLNAEGNPVEDKPEKDEVDDLNKDETRELRKEVKDLQGELDDKFGDES